MKKFKSIEQFRHAIKELATVHDVRPEEIVSFEGTVKMHGTNAGINIQNGEIKFQSRNNIISPSKDNSGFATFYEPRSAELLEFDKEYRIKNKISDSVPIVYFGEWVGKGIQNSVGVTKLPDKKFILFSIWVDGVYNDPDIDNVPDLNIYSILMVPKYHLDIDLANPQEAYNKAMEFTLEVENCCPVAKYFGIEGTGEGIVWRNKKYDVWFKTKGEKHSVSRSSKNPIVPEKLESILKFVHNVVTENRLNQGIQEVFMDEEPTIKRTGEFVKWVVQDVLKEEADTIEVSNFNDREAAKYVGSVASKWFVEKVNTL